MIIIVILTSTIAIKLILPILIVSTIISTISIATTI